MRVLAAVFAVGALAAATLGSQQRAGAHPAAASKIIDRTVSCTVGLTGGIREVEVSAMSGTRVGGKGSTWRFLAEATVEDFSGQGAGAAIAAGNPLLPPAPGVRGFPERLTFTSPPRCTAAARIPLSSAGLRASVVDALPQNPGDGIDCYPGTHVLIRLRGIFAAPSSIHVMRGGGRLGASGTVTVGYLAVRSARGKPLAYGEVFQNGKAKLFVARSCEQS